MEGVGRAERWEGRYRGREEVGRDTREREKGEGSKHKEILRQETVSKRQSKVTCLKLK